MRNNARLLFVSTALSALTSACIATKSQRGKDPVAQRQCLPEPAKQTSSLAVVDGHVTTGQSAVTILMSLSAGRLNLCTGTFVGSNVVVTAAHCINASVTGGLTVVPGINSIDMAKELSSNGATMRSKGITPLKTVHNGLTQETLMGKKGEVLNAQAIAFDLAFLILPANSAPAVATIRNAVVTPNTQGTVVGFGKSTHDQTVRDVRATKREGQLIVGPSSDIPGTLEGYTNQSGGSVRYASSAEGDSGGPLMVGSELIGTVSSGALNRLGDARSNFVDLNSAKSIELRKNAEAAGAIFGPSQETPVQTPGPNGPASQAQNCT